MRKVQNRFHSTMLSSNDSFSLSHRMRIILFILGIQEVIYIWYIYILCSLYYMYIPLIGVDPLCDPIVKLSGEHNIISKSQISHKIIHSIFVIYTTFRSSK